MYRMILVGPVACTLIGGAGGLCLGMLFRQEPLERAHVYLEDSLPLLLGGSVLGYGAGMCLFFICRRRPGALSSFTLLVMMALGAAIVAPLGWIAGDLGRDRRPHERMVFGAGMGAAIGLTLGAAQLLTDRWRRRAESRAALARIDALSAEQFEKLRLLARSGCVCEAVHAAEHILGISLGDPAVFGRELQKACRPDSNPRMTDPHRP